MDVDIGKKKRKQFSLVDANTCIIYLARIIGTTEKCLRKLREYNRQFKKYLDGAGDNCGKIPYAKYSEYLDKTSNVIGYLLNVIGDAQTSSISYFKYRKLVSKLVDKGVAGVSLLPLSHDETALLQDFNKLRNWHNHIPESLLISERELMDEGIMVRPMNNPIVLYFNQFMELDLVIDLYNRNVSFYENARRIGQAAKKDYSILIGEPLAITIEESEAPAPMKSLAATKISASIQGLHE
ncbi:hypothetical protein LJC33_08980 [Eubacteriales bacterium OttesenSCG-928-N13]|nr:hypothetical protein [Eubacteriales bacterium OttesenSCG-928-N13]